MATTNGERQELKRRAKELGIDPDLFVDAAEESEQNATGKDDQASPGATSQESAVKAHGGRGYFAYEFDVLTVNEVRASLFLAPIKGGDALVLDWRRQHGGAPAKEPE